MQLTGRLIAFLMLSFAASCATMPGNSCAGWAKIVPEQADVDAVSSPLARQILAHNDQGRALGCWK